MAKTNAERQKEFHQKMRDEGFVKVVVYAPEDKAATIRNMASEMRNSSTTIDVSDIAIKALEAAKAGLNAPDQYTRNKAMIAVKNALKQARKIDPI